ncbi:MAG: hypothetical protein EBR82_82435, partial [Caulobacteraceae bacterium]|nr:hypothetical protein [Caulobacteraceae bacterium]
MGTSDLETLLRDPQVRAEYTRLPADQAAAWAWRMLWLTKALKHQILPHGDDWSIWLMLAGRGAGKTRTAAEQIAWWAWSNRATRWLVAAPTSSDVRGTCFEGDSGLLNVIPPVLVADYNKALHELRLTNGSLIKGIPASEPERFRGPQFHGGWCDELAAWEYIQDSWDQIQFGMRLKLPNMKTRYVLQSYDCAFTEKTVNDPTAAITFGVFKPQDGGMCVLIIDAWQDRLQYPDLKPKVIDEFEIVFGEGKEAKRVDLVLVEDKAAGIVLIQDLQRAHIPVRSYNPGKADKI